MSDAPLSTLEGLAALRSEYSARIDGWVAPLAWGVAVGGSFPHVNLPGGMHGLASVALVLGIGHDGSTATREVTPEQLAAAIELLAPAEACTSVEHPNLVVWRSALAARAPLSAVFVADAADPVTSDLDAALRAATGLAVPGAGTTMPGDPA
ncbi:hypothetical protein [Nocardioides cavernaquae]|uniref:Uncharacterized protein n=1 Tax=Nocardioides cavernaquae TaxID=2321396 RepID=A0A3A5H2N7_9ACTN|nr:hypothetical protein [Nocardioides cavernaquae]RJS45039.1 hypothetical protein D4739_01450 [Nocardioides cavernaquae]